MVRVPEPLSHTGEVRKVGYTNVKVSRQAMGINHPRRGREEENEGESPAAVGQG